LQKNRGGSGGWRAALCKVAGAQSAAVGWRSGGPGGSFHSLHHMPGFHLIRSLFGSLCLEEKLVTEAHACATGGAAASTLFLFLCELLLLYSSCFFLARGTCPTRLTKEGIFGIFYGAHCTIPPGGGIESQIILFWVRLSPLPNPTSHEFCTTPLPPLMSFAQHPSHL
jgi:hypothetical protein